MAAVAFPAAAPVILGALAGALLAGSVWAEGPATTTASPPASVSATREHPGYIGSVACQRCHEREFAAWKGSDHDRAMEPAVAAAVLGDFADAKLEADGVTSTFTRRGGRFFVRTEGADGAPGDFEVKFTFGVRPLQQYLVEFPGGRLQALRQAWDSRPKEAGGQRWFHLYPGEKIAHDDALHWTGIYQNWNLQCAACHSTDLRKNYDVKSNSYATSYAEIDVACESCHGAGAKHAAWAEKAKPLAEDAGPRYATEDDKGLAVNLRGDPRRAWRFAAPDARIATLDPAADRGAGSVSSNVCAPCHARRSAVREPAEPAAPLEDSHQLAMLVEPLYFTDGQQQGEVYTWGSFLQSRMHARGVTCRDCHDPHSIRLRAEGNALCATCHNPAVFDAKSHHFHEPGGEGSACVDCHMPSRLYMVIDARHDHSLRVPRPDLSDALGTPDACSGCHAGRTPRWAAEAMDGWYGRGWRSRPEVASILAAPRTLGGRALLPLLGLAEDSEQPAIVRATAARLAEPLVRPDVHAKVTTLAGDPDALVRIAALGLVEPFPSHTRIAVAAPLLADPRRGVRIEAAEVLANARDDMLPPELREARARARKELLDSLEADSDWPSALVNLANFQLREGRTDEAAASLERALALDKHFAGAYVNLADVRRLQGRDAEGEELLRRGLVLTPKDAGLHHALGLLLVRRGQKEKGVEELAAAARLDADNARYAYVHAIGLQSAGRVDDALAALAEADRRHPYDVDILGALVSMSLEAGRSGDLLPHARRLQEVLPDDAGVRELVVRLEKGR